MSHQIPGDLQSVAAQALPRALRHISMAGYSSDAKVAAAVGRGLVKKDEVPAAIKGDGQLEAAQKIIADMRAEQGHDSRKELDSVAVDADRNDEEWTKGHAFNDDMIDSMKSYAEKKGYKVFVIKKCGSKFDIWFKNTFDPETCSRKSRKDSRSYVYVKW